MPSNIFINYRKEDSRWNTQALYNELLKYFPKESIFKDFNTIGLGEDYIESINKALEQCDVLLVIIGKNWVEIKNQKGITRLQDPKDLVRAEIATALKRNIKVIPVLFDNIEMFDEQDLPEDLRPITRRQYISVSDIKFDSDVQKLAEAIKGILGKSEGLGSIGKDNKQPEERGTDKFTKSSRWRTAAIVAAIGAVVSALACFLVFSNDRRFIDGGIKMLLNYSLGSGGFAGVLWLIVGAVAGPRKNLLMTAVLASFIALAAWIAVYGTYQDVIQAAIIFGMPIGAMLGILFAWLIKKIQVPASN